jgi:Flp pilus assembly pilin Flp
MSLSVKKLRNSGPIACMLRLWRDDRGQDITEYAVMLAAILGLVIGTIQFVGSRTSTVFSNAATAVTATSNGGGGGGGNGGGNGQGNGGGNGQGNGQGNGGGGQPSAH